LSTLEDSRALPLLEWRAFLYDIEKDTMPVECSKLFVVIKRKKYVIAQNPVEIYCFFRAWVSFFAYALP
jgi:hypothetical protein